MSGLGFGFMQHTNTEHKSTDRPCVSVFVLVIQIEVSVTKNYTHNLQTVLLKGRQCDVTPVLIKYSHFKTMVIDRQAVGAVVCMERACRMGSNQRDGYLPTGRAGDTIMGEWIHKRNK